MLDLTMGGRCISGIDAIAFFESLPDSIPDEVKTEEFCRDYEYALNRLKCEVRKSIPIAPKTNQGKFTDYSCGQCGHVLDPNDKYCPNCGRRRKRWND